MDLDTPNEDMETNVGTHLGKRKRLDDDTNKRAPFEASASFNGRQDSPDTDIDTPQNDRIQTMERKGFSECPVSLIQKLVKGKRAMEPKVGRLLYFRLSRN